MPFINTEGTGMVILPLPSRYPTIKQALLVKVGPSVFGMLGGKAGGYNGGVHAQQSPSARNATGGDIRSLCIMCGNKFKKGVILTRPMDLTDIAPTMCYASRLPQPKDATGGIVFQALTEE